MNAYLREEARWARDQARKSLREVDSLTDPKRVAARRRQIESEMSRATREHSNPMGALEARMAEVDDPKEAITQAKRDAHYWTQLAEGHEARLARDDEQPLFDNEEDA